MEALRETGSNTLVSEKLGCSQTQVFTSRPPPTTGAQNSVLWLGEGFFTKWESHAAGEGAVLALFWWDQV